MNRIKRHAVSSSRDQDAKRALAQSVQVWFSAFVHAHRFGRGRLLQKFIRTQHCISHGLGLRSNRRDNPAKRNTVILGLVASSVTLFFIYFFFFSLTASAGNGNSGKGTRREHVTIGFASGPSEMVRYHSLLKRQTQGSFLENLAGRSHGQDSVPMKRSILGLLI